MPWLRLVVSVAVLGPYVTLAVLGARYGVAEVVLALLFAAQLPVAYGLAVVGVSRARRGDVPDWRGLVRWAGVAARSSPRRRFASAQEAQTWFEWRLSGRILPAQMCVMLLFFSVPVVIVQLAAESASRDLFRLSLVPVWFLPLMGLSTGPAMARLGTGRNAHEVPSFLATRPLDNAGLIGAKLRMIARSVLVSFVLILVGTLFLCLLAGTVGELGRVYRGLVEAYGPVRPVAIVVLGALGLLAGTWSLMAANLWVGLAGRRWLVISYSFAWSLLFFGALFASWWVVMHPLYHESLKAAVPWSLVAAAVAKLMLAAWLLLVLCRRRVVAPATAWRLVGAWLVAVAGLLAVSGWLVPAELVEWHVAVAAAVLVLPAVGLELAPLALEWNRHR